MPKNTVQSGLGPTHHRYSACPSSGLIADYGVDERQNAGVALEIDCLALNNKCAY